MRRTEAAAELERAEIRPIIGSPANATIWRWECPPDLKIVVSNTDDLVNPELHFQQVQAMLSRLAVSSSSRLLVLFTSGCKDYGRMDEGFGSPTLQPQTEASPIEPPAVVAARALYGQRLLESEQPFDPVVLRPTIVYGNASSHYGFLFELAARSHGWLRLPAYPSTIMQSLHVDDCAAAYVSLVRDVDRSLIIRRAFNISSRHYETAEQIGRALAKAYRLELEFVDPPAASEDRAQLLLNFSQWISSDAVRALTGWGEQRPSFVNGIDEYRMAYEAWRLLRN